MEYERHGSHRHYCRVFTIATSERIERSSARKTQRLVLTIYSGSHCALWRSPNNSLQRRRHPDGLTLLPRFASPHMHLSHAAGHRLLSRLRRGRHHPGRVRRRRRVCRSHGVGMDAIMVCASQLRILSSCFSRRGRWVCDTAVCASQLRSLTIGVSRRARWVASRPVLASKTVVC